jgi:hypothetical protein
MRDEQGICPVSMRTEQFGYACIKNQDSNNTAPDSMINIRAKGGLSKCFRIEKVRAAAAANEAAKVVVARRAAARAANRVVVARAVDKVVAVRAAKRAAAASAVVSHINTTSRVPHLSFNNSLSKT